MSSSTFGMKLNYCIWFAINEILYHKVFCTNILFQNEKKGRTQLFENFLIFGVF